MKTPILIIDDEPSICSVLTLLLEGDYEVQSVTDAGKGLELLREKQFHLVLLDLCIGARDGIEVLGEIKKIDSAVEVIIMTAYGSIRSSVQAMKKGAFNYLTKPLDAEELCIFIEQAIRFRQLNEKVNHLSLELQVRQYHEMIGKSPAMQRVYSLIDKMKHIDASVTITGESGTGKELVARAIHDYGNRKNARFVDINSAAIPEGLLEEEFFGHKKGAFTGAVSDHDGKLAMADGGTLFLDEVGDMPLNLQGKLLRVLEQKEYSPIGSSQVRKVDLRVIAATNRDLRQMVRDRTFREDLFYRLNVMEIHVPALRERKSDIPLLYHHFLNKYSKEHNRDIAGITHNAGQMLMSYDYPGNVRELANMMEYATILSSGTLLDVPDFPLQLSESFRQSKAEGSGNRIMTLKEMEAEAILEALHRNGGHRIATAKELGISERGLRNKIQEYGLLPMQKEHK